MLTVVSQVKFHPKQHNPEPFTTCILLNFFFPGLLSVFQVKRSVWFVFFFCVLKTMQVEKKRREPRWESNWYALCTRNSTINHIQFNGFSKTHARFFFVVVVVVFNHCYRRMFKILKSMMCVAAWCTNRKAWHRNLVSQALGAFGVYLVLSSSHNGRRGKQNICLWCANTKIRVLYLGVCIDKD